MSKNNSTSFVVLLLLPFELIYIGLFALVIWTRNFLRLLVPASPRSLKGEVVLVTGGASGIGRAVCKEIAETENELTIIIWDVDKKGSDEVVADLKSIGVKQVYAFIVDVSNRSQVTSAADKIRDEIGDVTLLFNNAGISGNLTEGWNEEPRVIEKVFGINFLSHCWTLREFLPAMIKKGKGHVVETCSFLGLIPGPSGAAYVGSKFANYGYIEVIKEDLRHLPEKPQITFSTVFPIFVKTNLTAKLNMDISAFSKRWKFFCEPVPAEYAAETIMRGVLRQKEFIYISPMVWMMHVARTILPPEASRKLYDFAGVVPYHVQVEKQ